MKLRPIVLDYEGFPIEQRPHYPPEPTSFSLLLPEWKVPRFYAWGHVTGGNNCGKADAEQALRYAYSRVSEAEPLLCHNGKFDMDVSEEYFGLRVPPWHCFHDTMLLLFLEDPHQRELGLKPSADRLLGMAPEEQDAVKQWVLTNKKRLEADFPEIVTRYDGIKPSTAGRFVAYVPGTVVGPYANGDVLRTLKLFNLLFNRVTVERGMGEAYDRERRILPILLRNEREGIRVNEAQLAKDQPVYEAAQLSADDWIRKALKAPSLDLDQDREVAKTLFDRGSLTEYNYTPTGQLSVSKKNMKMAHFKDPKLAAAYVYRQKCATVLETFIRPWLWYSKDGRMHTNWNQVRQAKGGAGDTGDTGGTRTGRPSSNDPNFLNMPKKVEDGLAFKMPTHIPGLPLLPRVRSYILPDEKGHVIGRRDFNQQELRVLAHFEDGALLQAYLANPRLDVHQYLRDQIRVLLGIDVSRTITKNLNFGYLYGQGVGALALAMDRTVEEVQQFRKAQMAALPGLKGLSDAIKGRVKQGLPIVTWGGREYYVEPPAYSKKFDKVMSFEYKLINYLIQGSSADVTKESIIRYDSVRKDGRFMLSVYDENDISVHAKALKPEMLLLRECMMSIELDVPLLSDGEWGPDLGNLQDLKEPAPDLSRWGL